MKIRKIELSIPDLKDLSIFTVLVTFRLLLITMLIFTLVFFSLEMINYLFDNKNLDTINSAIYLTLSFIYKITIWLEATFNFIKTIPDIISNLFSTSTLPKPFGVVLTDEAYEMANKKAAEDAKNITNLISNNAAYAGSVSGAALIYLVLDRVDKFITPLVTFIRNGKLNDWFKTIFYSFAFIFSMVATMVAIKSSSQNNQNDSMTFLVLDNTNQISIQDKTFLTYSFGFEESDEKLCEELNCNNNLPSKAIKSLAESIRSCGEGVENFKPEIIIKGYASSSGGNSDINLGLSNDRAEEVKTLIKSVTPELVPYIEVIKINTVNELPENILFMDKMTNGKYNINMGFLNRRVDLSIDINNLGSCKLINLFSPTSAP